MWVEGCPICVACLTCMVCLKWENTCTTLPASCRPASQEQHIKGIKRSPFTTDGASPTQDAPFTPYTPYTRWPPECPTGEICP